MSPPSVPDPSLQSVIERCLGDDATDGRFRDIGIDTDMCRWHPDLALAVCVLNEPVTAFPIPPIMMGCETGLLEEGLEVAMVGFGDESNPPSEDETLEKRWGFSTLSQAGLELATFDPRGPTACDEGDLGSPLYAQYPDGTWHLLGVSRESNDCANNNVYVRMDRAVPWIEETFNVDITPCHDAEGNWSPSSACAGFPLQGPEGVGTWETWCEDAPRGERSTTCGPAWDADPEDAEASVELTSDPSPAELESGQRIGLTATVNHPVSQVSLEINGDRIEPVDVAWPYVFDAVEFPDGEYQVRAIALGTDDVERASEVLTVRVGEFPPEDGSSTGSDAGGTDDSSDEEPTQPDEPTSGDDAGEMEDADTDSSAARSPNGGCAVGRTRAFGAGLWMLGLLGLVRRRAPHSDGAGGTGTSMSAGL